MEWNQPGSVHHMCRDTDAVEAVRLMIQQHPEALHQPDCYNELPLHYACHNDTSGALGMIQMVLDADPTAATARGFADRLPLHIVCEAQSLAAVQAVLKAHPEALGVGDKNGQLALHYATCNQSPANLPIVQMLLRMRSEAVHATGYGQQLPLHYACRRSNSVAVVREVLEMYPDALRHPDDRGEFPVHRACQNKTVAAPEILRLLLSCWGEVVWRLNPESDMSPELGEVVREVREALRCTLIGAAKPNKHFRYMPDDFIGVCKLVLLALNGRGQLFAILPQPVGLRILTWLASLWVEGPPGLDRLAVARMVARGEVDAAMNFLHQDPQDNLEVQN